MDVLCKWMCYVNGCDLLRRSAREEKEKDGRGGQEPFKTSTHHLGKWWEKKDESNSIGLKDMK